MVEVTRMQRRRRTLGYCVPACAAEWYPQRTRTRRTGRLCPGDHAAGDPQCPAEAVWHDKAAAPAILALLPDVLAAAAAALALRAEPPMQPAPFPQPARLLFPSSTDVMLTDRSQIN